MITNQRRTQLSTFKTEFLTRVHQAEQRAAVEMTKAATLAVRDENLFADRISKSLVRLAARKIESEKQAKALGIEVSEFLSQVAPAQVSQFLQRFAQSKTDSIFDTISSVILPLATVTITEAESQGGIFKVDQASIDRMIDRKWAPDGVGYRDRVERLGAGFGDKFERIFKDGFTKGLGYPEITRNLRKEIAVSARQLDRIVRTEGQRVQSEIAIESYRRNQEYVSGIEYTSALDVNTCQVCGSYDRNTYYFDGASKMPSLPDTSDAPAIPVHPACRCFYIPISKFWETFGGDRGPQLRASQFGPVTGDYNDFLKRMQVTNEGWLKKHLGKFYEQWKNGRSINSLRVAPRQTLGTFFRSAERTFMILGDSKASKAADASKATPVAPKAYHDVTAYKKLGWGAGEIDLATSAFGKHLATYGSFEAMLSLKGIEIFQETIEKIPWLRGVVIAGDLKITVEGAQKFLSGMLRLPQEGKEYLFDSALALEKLGAGTVLYHTVTTQYQGRAIEIGGEAQGYTSDLFDANVSLRNSILRIFEGISLKSAEGFKKISAIAQPTVETLIHERTHNVDAIANVAASNTISALKKHAFNIPEVQKLLKSLQEFQNQFFSDAFAIPRKDLQFPSTYSRSNIYELFAEAVSLHFSGKVDMNSLYPKWGELQVNMSQAMQAIGRGKR